MGNSASTTNYQCQDKNYNPSGITKELSNLTGKRKLAKKLEFNKDDDVRSYIVRIFLLKYGLIFLFSFLKRGPYNFYSEELK